MPSELNRKARKMIRENPKRNLFTLIAPLVAAPLLFGIGALLLTLREASGPWYYILYFLLRFLTAGVLFLALHFTFRACPERGMPRALRAAIPLLASLSAYHFAISFFDMYAVRYEEGAAAIVYALLSLVTDSLLSEWLLLILTATAVYLFFLRGEPTPAGKRSARLFSALIYFAFIAFGRVSEFFSFLSVHFGFADEKTTLSFLLFLGADLLLAAFVYLVLLLSDKITAKGSVTK